MMRGTRFLGIDYGSKRIGVALSDDGGKLAFPKTMIENDQNAIKKIQELCDSEEVSAVVIGESRDSSGKENPVQAAASAFAKALAAATGLPVHWEPEFMTSHHAAIGERKGEFKKGPLDASAAALILQRYLDKRKSK